MLRPLNPQQNRSLSSTCLKNATECYAEMNVLCCLTSSSDEVLCRQPWKLGSFLQYLCCTEVMCPDELSTVALDAPVSLSCTVLLMLCCLQPCPRLRSFLREYRWLSKCIRKVGFSSPELFFDSRLWYKLICGFL